ncbi:MAG: DUF1559 domain-containing protein [Isosphaeraceae bacterium]
MTVDPRDDPEFHGPVPKPGSLQKSWLIEILLALGVTGLLVILLLPAISSNCEVSRATQCSRNMRQIALGLQLYHNKYGAFPPAYTVDADGQPLHSWRTLILPFIDEPFLYEDLDLTKPWDDPANARVFETPIGIYLGPESETPRNATTYLAITAAGGWSQPGRPRAIEEITDGPSNTLLLIEVDDRSAVPWGAPIDADLATILNLGGKSKTAHPGGFHAVFADGRVKFLKASLPAATRRALITIAGGEKVDPESY